MMVVKMIKQFRVMLIPNNKQNTKLFDMPILPDSLIMGIRKRKENYKNGGKFLSDSDLKRILTKENRGIFLVK